MLVALLTLLALAGTVLLCRRGSLLWSSVLVLLCGLWLLVDKPLKVRCWSRSRTGTASR